jgi:hypothetical protein
LLFTLSAIFPVILSAILIATFRPMARTAADDAFFKAVFTIDFFGEAFFAVPFFTEDFFVALLEDFLPGFLVFLLADFLETLDFFFFAMVSASFSVKNNTLKNTQANQACTALAGCTAIDSRLPHKTKLNVESNTMKSFFFAIFLLATSKCFALGFWTEPYAGYEIGNREQNHVFYSSSGIDLGFRAGGSDGFMIFGLEYCLSDLGVDESSADNIKTRDLGPFFGLNFTFVRTWVTYWIKSEGTSDQDGGYKGHGGYKLGLGFPILGPASLNIEKSMRIWKSFDSNTVHGTMAIDSTLLSVSMPFSF